MKSKLITVLALFMLLTSCNKAEERTETGAFIHKSDKNFNVTFLFEVDGVKVYRFSDLSNTVYFTNGIGRVESHYTTTRPRPFGMYISHHKVETICNEVEVASAEEGGSDE